MENPFFLKKKYNDLHVAPEVVQAAKRKEKQTGEKVPQDPSVRIQNYLDRFKEITDRKNPEDRDRGIEAVKRLLYRNAIVKPENIPESYWENQRRLAREQGHGDIEVSEEARRQGMEVIITDQKSSLDTWVDYLASEDAPYPDWLKYWTTRSILGMGEYDKEKKQFTKRSKGTVKPFPDLNREALAYVLDVIEKKYKKQDINLTALEEEDRKRFEVLLKEESFPKLYAYAIEMVTPASKELLTITEGKWVKYERIETGRSSYYEDAYEDEEPYDLSGVKEEERARVMTLVKSLQGHGTGWCTAGESTAGIQLGRGDFYVYYSLDVQGSPTIPRAAIRMEEDKIAEVRGIANEQNLDPYIGDVVQKKMTEFPDGKAYEKKASDMKHLTAVEKKVGAGESLTKDDLLFLYEIKAPIEGFGYKHDPRIEELRIKRNPKEDAPIVFECKTEEIAWKKEDVTEHTKAYVGKLFPGMFKTLNRLEHVYTSFPEGKIVKQSVEIGGKTEEQLEEDIVAAGMMIDSYALHMMRRKEFTTGKKPEQADLIRLTVGDLELKNPTTDAIFKKADELGLELCPAEVGPHLLFNYKNLPLDKWFLIAMNQIADPHGTPCVFHLENDGYAIQLNGSFAERTNLWLSDRRFVFRLRR